MRKKSILILLSICLILTMFLAACSSGGGTSGGSSGGGGTTAGSGSGSGSGSSGSDDGGSAETVHLTMWTWNRSIDGKAVEEYQEMNPHIKIDLQYSDQGDVANNLIAAFSSGSGAPDVVGIEIKYVERFKALPQHFHNLYDYGARNVQGDYLDWKWKQAETPDGEHLLALPIDIGPMVMAYRIDIFEQAGLPTDPAEVAKHISTWEDFIAAGQQVLDRTGVKMINEIFQLYEVVANQHDVMYFDYDDNLVLESTDQVLRAWDLAVQASELGLSANLETFTTEWGTAMNNGDYAVQFAPAWMMNFMKENAPDAAGLWALAPMPEGGGNWGGSFLGIPSQSKHPQEAYDFIEWLLAPEQQVKAFEREDLFPSTPGIYDYPELREYTNDYFATPNVGEIYSEAAATVIPQYRAPDHVTVNDVIKDALGQIEDGVTDPQTAWNQALEEIDRQLSR